MFATSTFRTTCDVLHKRTVNKYNQTIIDVPEQNIRIAYAICETLGFPTGKIPAIKTVRNGLLIGLKDAKDAVDFAYEMHALGIRPAHPIETR